jgi:IclR family transcriptional regulator, KDG regulon repressor
MEEGHLPAREKETYCIHSVENALALLEALCEEGEEVSLSGLSQRLGMTKASLFRLLATFENHGYVEREPGSRKYQLGMAAYEMGQKFLSHMSLLRKARPVMEHLARNLNEAIYLVVRRGNEVLFLDMADSTQQVKIAPLVGRRFPIEKTAAGKIFLAFATPDPSPAHTRGKNTQSPLISTEEGAKIRRYGYCIDHGNIGEQTTCIATSLLKGSGEVAGVLALLGPEFRMGGDRIDQHLLPALFTAAEIVSSQLGYLGHIFGEKRLS